MKMKNAFDTFITHSGGHHSKIGLLRSEGYTQHVHEMPVDNFILDKFFSDFDSMYQNNEVSVSFERQNKIDEILFIINSMLPEIEKYVIVFTYFFKKKQETIGQILSISQEMVCYYRKRALKRINLLYILRQIDIVDMEKFLDENVTRKQKVAMIEYFREHDLKKATDNIIIIEKRNMTNRTIGIRITLGVKKIKQIQETSEGNTFEKANKYLKIFNILQQYNSLYCSQSRVKLKSELQL